MVAAQIFDHGARKQSFEILARVHHEMVTSRATGRYPKAGSIESDRG